jgi:hypothetical protein
MLTPLVRPPPAAMHLHIQERHGHRFGDHRRPRRARDAQSGNEQDVERDVGDQSDRGGADQPPVEVGRDRRGVQDPGAEHEDRSARQDLQRRDRRHVGGPVEQQQHRPREIDPGAANCERGQRRAEQRAPEERAQTADRRRTSAKARVRTVANADGAYQAFVDAVTTHATILRIGPHDAEV